MGELTASIAHEVRQPIAGVLINGNTCLRLLDRAKGESDDLAAVRAALQRIMRDGDRAVEIIARIQSLFRKTETAKEPLSLNETIRDIVVVAKSEIDKQRVTLHLDLSRDLPNVLGDRVQLQQVLINLVMNGIDAMRSVTDRPRKLDIKSAKHADGVLIQVRDSGLGLAQDRLERVFEPFFTTKPQGIGMGLSISRSIIESHGGRLWTVPVPNGALFQFTLPTNWNGVS